MSDKIHAKHLSLVDAANDSRTEDERKRKCVHLMGFREGVEASGRRLDLIACDLHTMERFGEDREMVCGVLLDWKPADPLESHPELPLS